MKNLLLFLFILSLGACQEKITWTNLLDQEMSQWDNYLSYQHKLGYNGNAPVDLDSNLVAPIGLNQKQQSVFTVVVEGNEPILKVSGEIYGCVITKLAYANYHLRLQVRWGENKFVPREDLLKDSGILYHSIGEPGVDYWRAWMLSQEFQIMEGHMGDYWSIANSAIDIRSFIPEYTMDPVADPSQPFIPVGGGEKIPGFCLRSANYEKPSGEWNTLELICYEDKSIHIVNGHVVMILRNSRYSQEGKPIPMTTGKIQLQSEAAEVHFKTIEIRNLVAMPSQYATYF